jgi:DNA mismatch repair protein MutL
MAKIHRCLRTSPIRSPPAKSWSVRRPVIKELVENSIDAGARRLCDHRRVRRQEADPVEDDGEGMDAGGRAAGDRASCHQQDRRADDLERIATLGFRGEALPSIASVSHFVLRTRARGADTGTEIRVNGGAVASVAECGAPKGHRSRFAISSTTCRPAASS